MTLFVNFYITHATPGCVVDQGGFDSDPSELHVGTDTVHLFAPASTEIISNSSLINPMI